MHHMGADTSAWLGYLTALLVAGLVIHAVLGVVRAARRESSVGGRDDPRHPWRSPWISAIAAVLLAGFAWLYFYESHGPGTPPPRSDPSESGINRLIDEQAERRAGSEPTPGALQARQRQRLERESPELERTRDGDFEVEREQADRYIDRIMKKENP